MTILPRFPMARTRPTITEASQKPVPLDPRLAGALHAWRRCTSYRAADDWVFARQPPTLRQSSYIHRASVLRNSCFRRLPRPTFAQGTCTNSTIKGSYGFAGTGFVPESAQGTVRFDPVSHVATAIYDGQGKISVKARVQYHGKVSPLDFNGSYDVHSDCTGSASFEDSSGKTLLMWNFVIVHGGDAVETIALRAPSQAGPCIRSRLARRSSNLKCH
jgi:hypothetical protein